MKIRVGFEMLYDFPQPTPMILVLGTHFTRASDVIVPDFLTTSPAVEITPYRDMFGNWCSRMVAPAGRVRFGAWSCQNGFGDVGPGSQGPSGVSGRDRSDQRLDPEDVHDPCQIVGQD